MDAGIQKEAGGKLILKHLGRAWLWLLYIFYPIIYEVGDRYILEKRQLVTEVSAF